MATAKNLKWVLGARSETGYVRTANEDRMGFIRAAYGDVYVVSDGMGGYRGGAMAAELTVRTLQERLAALSPASGSFPEQVRDAFLAANQAVFQQRSPDNPDTRDMGATGVALITAGARAMVGHVGDSRAYLMSRGAMRQLTRDHTRVQKMVDAGLLTPAQAGTHPDASMLDRAIGHEPTVEVDVSSWITLKPGDMVLLCSDGLCGYVADAEIGTILRSKGSPQALADQLVDCALGKGGEDNVTVQLVRLGGGPRIPWLVRLRQPAIVAPASVLASAMVAWGVGGPYLDAADGRTAALQKELAASQQQVAALQQTADTLNKQVAGLRTQLASPAPAAAPTAAPASAIPAAAPKPVAPKPSPPQLAKKKTATSPKPPAPSASSAASAPADTPLGAAASAAAPGPIAVPPPTPPAPPPPAPAPVPLPAPPGPSSNDTLG